LIKTEKHAIAATELVAKERASIAHQLSEWGASTGDDAVGDISSKLAVLLTEIANLERAHAESLEIYRGVLKQIRNVEGSVQPVRDLKFKVCSSVLRRAFVISIISC